MASNTSCHRKSSTGSSPNRQLTGPAISKAAHYLGRNIAKARISLIVPMPSFMRYLETGHIDLTDVQYTLTPDERIDHLKTIARTLTKSQGITLGTMHLSSAFLSYKEANLAFYSNYHMSFFKKNTLAMNSRTDPFYIIIDKELDKMVLDYFNDMTQASYYQPCSAQDLESKIRIYQHMLEKITSLAEV